MNIIEKRMERRGQGGFTLIELLVVIAILAILAGVVVFAVGNSAENANRAACDTERASIVTAANAADLANQAYGGTETYVNYLDTSAGPLQYFAAPASGTATRINTGDVSAALCTNITGLP